MGGWLPWMDDPDNSKAEAAYREEHTRRSAPILSPPPPPSANEDPSLKRAYTYLTQGLGVDFSKPYADTLLQKVANVFKEWDLTGDQVLGRQKLKIILTGEDEGKPSILQPVIANAMGRQSLFDDRMQMEWNFINDMDHPSMFDD